MPSNWWRRIAPVYSRLRRMPVLRYILRHERRALLALLGDVDRPEGLALDIGTGPGDTLGALPPGRRVLLDASFAMLRRAAGTMRIVARAEALPFRPLTFSFISAVGVLEYIPRPEILFREAKRVGQPRALLLLTASPPNAPNSLRRCFGTKLYLRPAAEIADLISRAGFSIANRRTTFMQIQWLCVARDEN